MANTTITPGVTAATLTGVAASLLMTITPSVSVEVPYESATVTWPAIPNGSPGGASPRLSYKSASFQATGVWGSGGSVRLEGSQDAVNWFALTPAALTGAGLFAALGASERPKYIRPSCTAGDSSTSITITGWFS